MLANIKIKVNTFNTVSVPNTGILIMAANPRRFYALITNPSNTDIWLYFDSQGAVNQGIYLPRDGFSYEITRDNLWQGSIYAIHSAVSAKSVVVYEGQ